MVSVGGLASGIDSKGIISQLVSLERRPIMALQRQIAQIQRSQTLFNGFAGRISDLRSAAAALSSDTLHTPTISGGDGSIATVTATKDAVAGSYDVTVHQLATVHRMGSQGFADPDTTPIAAGPGTFTVQSGRAGAQISVAVNATTTLRDLANGINGANGDVSAAVVNDGTGANGFRLVLTSKNTGAAAAVAVGSNPTSLDFGNASIGPAAAGANNAGTYTGTVTSSGSYSGTSGRSFTVEIMAGGAAGAATYRVSSDGGMTWDDNGGAGYGTSQSAAALGAQGHGVELAFSDAGLLSAGDRFHVNATHPTLQEARDAVFTLNGIRQTRSANVVSDAVQGLTLTLRKAGTETSSFAVSRSNQPVIERVEKLVSAMNDLVKSVRDQQKWDKDTKQAGPLLGDATANALVGQIRGLVVETAPGASSGLRSLLDLGVKSSDGGVISLDRSKLEKALTDNRAGVLAVLGSVSGASNTALGLTTRPAAVPDGRWDVDVTVAPERARVVAGAAQVGALAQAERLTFTYSADYGATLPSLRNFEVELQAGDTQAQVIDRLNSAFNTQGVGLRAFAEGGVLVLESTAAGAGQRLTVASDQAAGPGRSPLATPTLPGPGVDLAGTCGGRPAPGARDRLTAATETDLAGLVVTYRGSGLGNVGSVYATTGLGSRIEGLMETLTGGEKTLLGAKNKAFTDQIAAIEKSINRREDQVQRVQQRLEKQFARLEVTLGGMKSQGDFLNNQLALMFK